jgi:hypothetical protein
MILFVDKVRSELYVEFGDLIGEWRPLCPLCLVRNLVKNGGYSRLLTVTLLPKDAWIYRKWCPGCRQSFTLLPEDVMPLHSYGQSSMSHGILACINGVAQPSPEYCETGCLLPVKGEEAGPGDAPLVELKEGETFTPSYQLFQLWRQKFARSAHLLLPGLLMACILAGCDLRKRLGESLSSFNACPTDLRPLLLAAGLVGLLREQAVSDCLAPTLRLLCGTTSRSHKPSAAAARPPPNVGQTLDTSRFRADMKRRSTEAWFPKIGVLGPHDLFPVPLESLGF